MRITVWSVRVPNSGGPQHSWTRRAACRCSHDLFEDCLLQCSPSIPELFFLRPTGRLGFAARGPRVTLRTSSLVKRLSEYCHCHSVWRETGSQRVSPPDILSIVKLL